MSKSEQPKKPKEWRYEGKPISLHGLEPEEALKDLLETEPPVKDKPKKADKSSKQERS